MKISPFLILWHVSDTKIANELFARISEINATFTAEPGKIYTKINGKLTAGIAKIKAYDDFEVFSITQYHYDET